MNVLNTVLKSRALTIIHPLVAGRMVTVWRMDILYYIAASIDPVGLKAYCPYRLLLGDCGIRIYEVPEYGFLHSGQY